MRTLQFEIKVLLSLNRYKDSGESIKSFPASQPACFCISNGINFLVIKGAKWRDLISRINNAAASLEMLILQFRP